MKLKIDKINRIVLLGGGDLLLRLVRWCLSKGLPVSVITSPRHANEIIEANSSLKKILAYEKVSFLVVEDISSTKVVKFLDNLDNTFCLSLGAAWIFKDYVIKDLFKKKLYNMHGTRLPQNRGGGGFSWQIMMGNRLGFCQLHLVDKGVDTGDIIKTEEFLYPPSCRIPKDYINLYREKNMHFITSFIEEIIQKSIDIETYKQTEYFSSYFPRLSTPDHGWIDWKDNIYQLERFICAFDEPYSGAKTFWNKEVVYIKKVCIDFSDPTFHPYQSGLVYRNNTKHLSICAVGGTLIIESITNAKGRNLISNIKVGDRLMTDSKTIDGRRSRVVFTAKGKKK